MTSSRSVRLHLSVCGPHADVRKEGLQPCGNFIHRLYTVVHEVDLSATLDLTS